jgi:hypothetical protein
VPYDGAANEEYWGLVDVVRTAKLAYGVVGAVYTGPTCLVSAHAGPDQFLPVGATVTVLDGSASSHSGALTFQWSQSGGPTTAAFSDPSSMVPTVGNLTAGVYTFALTVLGDCGTSTDAVRVTVNATANIAPVADAGLDQILALGSTATELDGSASSDPDGGPAPLSYAWSQTAGPVLPISSTAEPSPLVAGVVDGESYTFELVVFDGLDTSAPSSVRIRTARLFADDFESGGLSGWSGATPDDGPSKGGAS